jgi:hypothetical protein
MAKIYVGRCPSTRCSGGTANSAFPLQHPERYGIPAGILQAVPDDDQICFCSWCKLVWQQPKVAKLGVEAMPLGYTEEDADGKQVFKKNSLVPMRDWKLNLKQAPAAPHRKRNSQRRNRR